MRNQTLLSTLFAVLISIQTYSQNIQRYQPGEIRQRLEKLNVLGTVLYVAAHPDDENTRLITYYANEELMRTAYLSATRGDGGQNLIGSEISEGLGVIRTQELLAARRTDGGQQFFSRANDFGYSKHPDETFNIWNKDQVLADFVWVFRKFRPDVIITRFNTTPGVTHGHHTSSAILAQEAFELSGDENAYPEQLEFVQPWKPKKLFWNTSWWFYQNSGEKMDTTNLTKLNVGKYNPLLGESYTEIASRSRSMHKSQGFGSSGSRGDETEYLVQWKGDKSDVPFGDISTSWSRVEGAEEVAFFINKAITEYNEDTPWGIAEPLVLARKALENVKDQFWKEIKKKEIDELIMGVTGLYLSLRANASSYSVGDSISISLEAVNRSNVEVKLNGIKFNSWVNPVSFETTLLNNRPFKSQMNFQLPPNMPYTTPYWLVNPSQLGMYSVPDQNMRGKPENDAPITGTISLQVGGETIDFLIPVVFKRTDPVDGEVTEPITIGPPLMMNMDASVLVFGDDSPKQVNVRLIAGRNSVEGELMLNLPKGWKSTPEKRDFTLQIKDEEQIFSFLVTPPKKASEGQIKPVASIKGKLYSKGRTVIDYDHIPKQTLYPEATVKVVRLDLVRKGNLIGYIEGAGDAIHENLEEIGYKVDRLSKDDIEINSLAKYDAIILGVRAFNTIDWLAYKNVDLFEYVKNGGNLIVQYNTSHSLVTKDIAPYDLKLSRDRVAVEEAPINILAASHPLIQGPNRITSVDFDNWVQERGLYFPNEWASEFTPILSSNDPGESPKAGGLLVGKYGEGYYIYSGYSWFRELPAGVPGAYRIFVNMISLGK